MSFKTLQIDIDRRGVARLWLNRPDKHHALNAEMIAELHQAALQLGADEAVRVVVIGSDGPVFCAGGDLRWMQDQQQKDAAGPAGRSQNPVRYAGGAERPAQTGDYAGSG